MDETGSLGKKGAIPREAGEIFPGANQRPPPNRLIFGTPPPSPGPAGAGAFFEPFPRKTSPDMATNHPENGPADLEVTDGSTQSPNQAKNPNDTNQPVTPKEELEEKEHAKAKENEKYVGG